MCALGQEKKKKKLRTNSFRTNSKENETESPKIIFNCFTSMPGTSSFWQELHLDHILLNVFTVCFSFSLTTK